ncbi:sodium:solute symporter family protein [Synoicihabitans lomoniglobus]|uniref:Sodium:solute symporter family protein n=1 Tax=Synoicihabitans lomoniglobus TaxID=2909285 RepID=A0AAF0A0I0_9BACT|nr:sodium:solute symporter family protein [Opitutaceae bacterium LMO-M01]WED64252.1 sodium:solute symporter family protein [Opitutaceae bacterium LMO-M01]
MRFGSLHLVDLLVILAYLAVVIYIGRRAAAASKTEEGYFLAGRKLGKLYQFFLNFGNATDANGAVSTASLVYQKGASGVWLSLQTLFMNPYYWFMNPWFRRVRLVTVADLFEDRFGTRGLARFYAIFQIVATVIVIIGFGNLVGYKVTASLLVKPEARWTAEERVSVESYQEFRALEKAVTAGTISAIDTPRLELLREQNKRGELRSNISWLDSSTGKWAYYLIYSLVVGAYIVMGGLEAAAVNEAFQGILIVVFSIILIPFGLNAIGGWSQLAERVPPDMFRLLGGGGANSIGGWELFGIFLISLIQIHGIIGNMSVSGSAKNEFAARFGAVTGTYAKRVMIILWAFCGLIAIALYQGADKLSDPDSAWGTMALQLLQPGFLGLMMAGLLAANMSTIASQTMAVSALFTRNVYGYFVPDATPAQMVRTGRFAIVGILAIGVYAAANMDDVYAIVQLLLTINVPFGAAVMLIFFWRRLTSAAVWSTVIISAFLNIITPSLIAPHVDGFSRSDTLTQQVEFNGRPVPVFFDTVVREDPSDPTSDFIGQKRFHLELYVLNAVGLDVAALSPSGRNAARFIYDGLFPFLVLFAVSLFTRAPDRRRTDLFFGKMKTPVGADPRLEDEAMAETGRNPGRFDDTKIFGPHSSWEFTKWNKLDTLGFIACLGVSFGILGAFWLLLRAASGA